MKLILLLTITLCSLPHSWGKAPILDYYDPILNDLENFKPEHLENMLRMKPEKALLKIGGFYSDYEIKGDEDKKTYRQALAHALLKHPEVEEFSRRSLASTPRYYENSDENEIIWSALKELRSSWVVELLANELMDDTPVHQPGYTDEEEIKNMILSGLWKNYHAQARVVYALTFLDLPHTQDFDLEAMRSNGRGYIEEWQTWWTTYGDEVLATLQAEETERAEFEAQAIATTQAKTEHYQNHPRNPPAPPSTPSEPKEPTSPTSKKAMVIALTLLAISLLVFLLVRLKSRNSQKS